MNDIIVVFRSRNDALTFNSKLAKYGVYGKVVNTPRALSASCGLSVRVSASSRSVESALCPTDATIYEIRGSGYTKIG